MPEVHQDDFFWVDSNEPHAQRRKAVLAKYGSQVRKLYGYDNKTAYQVQLCGWWQYVPAMAMATSYGSIGLNS